MTTLIGIFVDRGTWSLLMSFQVPLLQMSFLCCLHDLKKGQRSKARPITDMTYH